MYCAECGSKMSRHDHGAWVLCCNGYGYWWTSPPHQKDLWLGVPYAYVDMSNGNRRDFWFYKTVNWPFKQEPVPPKLD